MSSAGLPRRESGKDKGRAVICERLPTIQRGDGLSKLSCMLKRIFRPLAPPRPVVSPPGTSRIPPGKRVYAVGDIHGRLDLLDKILDTLQADALAAAAGGEQPIVVFLGDYVDRGPDSRGVIDRLCTLPAGPIEWHFLEGNHEMAMCAFMANPLANTAWLRLGGLATLASYDIDCPHAPLTEAWLVTAADALAKRLPSAHRQFLDDLDWLLEWGDYAFTHAGVRPGVALHAQSRFDLVSIRQPFLSSPDWHGKRIVHGHTVVREPAVSPHRVGIDTGAYFSGRLTCAVLRDTECTFFSTCEEG